MIMADIQGPPPAAQPERVRKRRRRTMACTQCRSRKLRCDREYPTCGRCLKSRTPNKCSYEDGFLWQQPSTVSAVAFASDRGSTISAPPRVDRTPVHTPPDSGTGTMSIRTESFVPTKESAPSASQEQRDYHLHHDLDHHSNHALPPFRTRPPRERRDCFLETVLGAPKAAVNQEPYANSEVVQRPKRPAPELDITISAQADEADYGEEESDGAFSPSQKLDLSPRMMMRGRETKTRFNGSGVYANIVAQFLDIRSFAEEIRLSNPILSQVRPDLERVKKGVWKRIPLNEPFPEPTTASLISLLPSRAVVDELVGLYLTYIESTHRIFHAPTFLRDLDKFWSLMDTPNMASPSFAAQLLLMLSCAWHLADPVTLQEKNGEELKCYTAVEWVLHAEKWIENLHVKRPEINSMRISILLIKAWNWHGMKRSQAWLATGTLVRQAMMAGYHRDPSRYTRISSFNKEMRRRIWTTIVELDLQVAFDRGMPPSVQSSDYDVFSVLNINDDEFYEGATDLPTGRALSEVTDASFQSVLVRSLPLRLKVCHLMHSPRISCRYEEIHRLDWELNRHIARIPAWTALEGIDAVTQHKVSLWKALIETKLAQALLSIHTPFAIEARRESLFVPSARSRMDIASKILSTQRQLHETSRPLSLCLLGEWTLQAYMSICQILHSGESRNAPDHPTSTMFSIHNLPGLPESLISLVETTLVCLEGRFLLVVKGAKDYFFLSTIVALVKARLWPTQAVMYKQQVVERILSFAQTLFSRHASCEHLGTPGMGSFKTNQVAAFTATPGVVPVLPSDLENMLPSANLGSPGEFDPFLDVFDWEDLTGYALGD
ncbi:hypothetical protein N7510_000420 [Penicillium lagena]|uniref:uncharacterized protein n=1 Tax=Penicillium lagena TaxID=94218 RepID=UPI002541934E|nr:uncharacterized protein N7510_000420 [Penicillium lagena]KAJ5624111.1 hypothetical protein N7510_000420 [Penicillium lagena]